MSLNTVMIPDMGAVVETELKYATEDLVKAFEESVLETITTKIVNRIINEVIVRERVVSYDETEMYRVINETLKRHEKWFDGWLVIAVKDPKTVIGTSVHTIDTKFKDINQYEINPYTLHMWSKALGLTMEQMLVSVIAETLRCSCGKFHFSKIGLLLTQSMNQKDIDEAVSNCLTVFNVHTINLARIVRHNVEKQITEKYLKEAVKIIQNKIDP